MDRNKTETDEKIISGGHALPAGFYGLITQIMLYVKKMDEDYLHTREKEQD